MQEKIPAMIFGCGAVSREAAYLIQEINAVNREKYEILGFIAETIEQVGQVIDGVSVICTDSQLEQICKQYKKLALVIPMANPRVKREIYQKIEKYTNCYFPNLIHPSVNIRNLSLGKGNIVQENVSISIGVSLGDFALVNYGAFLGHDVKIEDFCVVGPLAKICGNVTIKNESFIGVGATVLQNIGISQEVVVGAGAVVTKGVEAGKTVVGIPAKVVPKKL